MPKSETKATKLDNFFRDDFERGKTDKFIVNMKDIGDPLLCKLGTFSNQGYPDTNTSYFIVVFDFQPVARHLTSLRIIRLVYFTRTYPYLFRLNPVYDVLDRLAVCLMSI